MNATDAHLEDRDLADRDGRAREAASPETCAAQFELAVRRLADDLRFGLDSSTYMGSGVDYVQSRPYVDGDSIKDIDWKVTARTQRYHVKQFESLKCTPVYLVVDTSASMTVSSLRMSKYDWAVLIAGGVGLAALRRLSPVGILAAGDRELHWRPSLSRGQVFVWLHELRRRTDNEHTLLGRRLDELTAQLTSRALVVVISDLHDPQAIPAIKRTAARHDCAVLQLQDPAERGRIRSGFMRGLEAETGRAFVAHGRTRWFGAAETPGQVLRQSGIDHLLLPTSGEIVALLRRFLAERGGWIRPAR